MVINKMLDNKKYVWLIVILLFTYSCRQNKLKTFNEVIIKPVSELKIKWSDSLKYIIKYDKRISYVLNNLKSDSVLLFDYIGFEGEHIFFPINEKGELINTINKIIKLEKFQIKLINEIISDNNTYKNPSIIPCFEPHLSIAYFLNGKVIGQTIICLSCSRIASTIPFNSENDGSLINKEATSKLITLCNSLNLTNCNKK